MRKPRVDWQILWPAVLILGSVVVLLMAYPAEAKQISAAMLSAIYYNFGAFAQWVVLLSTGWLLWLAMSKYGNVKLGGFEDQPEFSTVSWVSLMITAGSSMSLMIMASVEPISHIGRPPVGILPKTMESVDWSVAYGMFHWGFPGWSLYSLAGVAIAYAYHVRKIPYLKGSIACSGILGSYVNGWLGKVIDLTVALGLVGGVGTSAGIIVPVLSALISEMFGFQQSLRLDGLVTFICTVVAAYTVYLGLHKGMEKLSEIRSWSSLGLTLFVFLAGPTAFLISFSGQSLGLMFQNYFTMSTYLEPFSRNSWAEDWTVFYFAWWASYSLYMGLFIARISKGRTIRQMIIGSLVVPSLVCFFAFMAFGGYAIYLQQVNHLDLVLILDQQGMGALVVCLLETLPFHQVIIPLYVISGIISMATTFQGAAYGLASIASEKLFANEDPAAWHRFFWAMITGCFGFALVMVDDLKVVKLASVISLVPILLICIIMIFSFMRWIRIDFAASRASNVMVLNVHREKKEGE